MKPRLIVGISGATGSIYARRLLEVLKASDQIETHLVISQAAKRTLREETPWCVEEIENLAHFVYTVEDRQARILDKDFEAIGMVVIPCSVKSMAAIALSRNDNLLIQAANAILQTGRKLVLVVRETPIHIGHIKIMLRLAEAGAVLLPPIPTFERQPKTIDDLVDQIVHRVLNLFKT